MIDEDKLKETLTIEFLKAIGNACAEVTKAFVEGQFNLESESTEYCIYTEEINSTRIRNFFITHGEIDGDGFYRIKRSKLQEMVYRKARRINNGLSSSYGSEFYNVGRVTVNELVKIFDLKSPPSLSGIKKR